MSKHPGKETLIDLLDWANSIGDVQVFPDSIELILNYITDLEARLEKAEAERDALKALAERQLGQMIEKAAQARNDALEEAAKAVEDHSQVGTRSAVAMAAYSNAANAVRKLKDKS
jgi:hypothetical protein